MRISATENKIVSWILAARVKTLTAAIVPVFVATGISYFFLNDKNISMNWSISIFAILSAVFIQIGTNLINDALDFKKGADTEKRIGPKRVTQSGLISSTKVLIGAFLCFLLACVFGFPLVYQSGKIILYLGIVSMIFGYLYTGGPYPLAYKGLGELFVLIFFGFAAVLGVIYIYTGMCEFPFWSGIIGSLQVGLLSTVLISINNCRDYISDREAKKMTLAARFGLKFARVEIALLIICSYLLGIFWIFHGNYFSALAPILTLPIAVKIIKGIFNNNPSPLFNKFLGLSALLQLVFGFFLGLGFFIG